MASLPPIGRSSHDWNKTNQLITEALQRAKDQAKADQNEREAKDEAQRLKLKGEAEASKETDHIRREQSMANADSRRKDLALSTAKQQSDLELERRRNAASLALSRITGFRG